MFSLENEPFLLLQKGGKTDVGNDNGNSNLKPIRSSEEARERGRLGGIKSGEARRRKKSMKETAKLLLNMQVQGDANKTNLTKFGIEESDQNYQTALIVRMIQKALIEGDTSSIRLLGELTGELGAGSHFFDDPDIIDMEYPTICLPDNGRDKKNLNVLRPQAGPQTMFMCSEADIVIYGGAAGGGKTYALLLEALRHKDVPNFGAVIFRHTYTQISSEGGLWDASKKLYNKVPGAMPGKTPKLHWKFSDTSKITFAHIGTDDDLENWQGSEICYIGFDELTHFSRKQFLYMQSRNRSTCGIRPYIRASCNPDSDSWVAEFIDWWWDDDTGYPIPERSGKIRYMCVLEDVIHWADTREELAEKYGVDIEDCRSVTFIASKLEDNKILMETDPGYLASLKALGELDMERLLKGNWKIKAAAGMFFKRVQLREYLDSVPTDIVSLCRAWDLAATDKTENEDAAYTAGVLMGVRADGSFVVIDVINQQLKAGEVRELIKTTAKLDTAKYGYHRIRLPQDPGQAGKEQAQSYMTMLSGYDVVIIGESGSKQTRAEPMAAQWQHGNFSIVIGEWNEVYLNQLESFPESKWKDMVDASSSAFNEITLGMSFNVDNLL